MSIGSLEPTYRSTDFTVQTSFGAFQFTRSYASSEKAWKVRPDTPGQPLYRLEGTPFGNDGASLHWWHNLFSFVALKPGYLPHSKEDPAPIDPRWALRDVDGKLSEFTVCSPAPCWAGTKFQGVTIEGAKAEERLYYLGGGGGFILYRPEARYHFAKRYDYQTLDRTGAGSVPVDVYTYFLTRIEDGQYPATGGLPRNRLVLSYDPPSSATGDCKFGAPRVQRADTPNQTYLQFNYEELPSSSAEGYGECVLRSVELKSAAADGGSSGSTLVSYQYWQPSGTGEKAGRIAGAYFPETGRRVSYSVGTPQAPQWSIAADDVTVSTATLRPDGGTVAVLASEQRSVQVAWEDNTTYDGQRLSVTCGAGVLGPPTALSVCFPHQNQMFTELNATRGDSTLATGATVKKTFQVNASGAGPLVSSEKTVCTGACAALGTTETEAIWQWNGGPDGVSERPLPTAYRDRRSNWTWYTNSVPTRFPLDAGFEVPQETTVVNVAGVRTTSFEYDYGSEGRTPRAYEQFAVKVIDDSVDAGAKAETFRRYDLKTNRLEAVIRTGYTRTLVNGVPGELNPRSVATLYYTYRKCSGETPAQADPLGRTVEVHGPCFVSGPDATECEVPESSQLVEERSALDAADGGSVFRGYVPVTQFDYYSGDAENEFKANRLSTKTVFARANGRDCRAATGLVTQYTDYDARGRVLASLDPNGARSTATFTSLSGTEGTYEKSTAITAVNQPTTKTRYVYDGAQLRYIQYPAGHYEVFCYRKGGGVPCQGERSDKLQWKATMPKPDGAEFFEKTEYTYQAEQLASERVLDGTGAVRTVKQYAADPLGRPTYERTGEGTGAYASVALFNVEGAQVGIGAAYNAPPDLCGGLLGIDAKASDKCAGLGYDAANRLSALEEYSASGGPSTRTTITYDRQGHVSRVVPQCNSASGPCTSGGVAYVHDDFGNVIEVTAPWTGAAGAPGTSRFEYDAAGTLIRKRTPGMASGEYLEYGYDGMQRLLQARRRYGVNGSSWENLYWFEYDDYPTGAPANCIGANTKGRMVRRNDSFGDTWFSYDAWGRVVWARRQRVTGEACSKIRTRNTPNSEFTYDAFGRLKSEVYPHGRKVSYAYYELPQGHPERLKSLSVDGTWDPTQPTVTLIQNIQWEPYGGLRGYEMNTFAAPDGVKAATVEYLPGDAYNTAAASCARTRPSTTDRTGRLRGLWVSRGAYTPLSPSGSGDIFKQTYAWSADQLAQTETCLLDTAGAPRTVRFDGPTKGYDQQLRLTNVTRPPGEFGTKGGTLGRRAYQYAGNGNRTEETRDCWGFQGTYSGDRLLHWGVTSSQCNKVCGPSRLGYDFTYDGDGRVAQKLGAVDSSGGSSSSLTFDASADGAHAAVGAVYRSVSVRGGSSYEYFYDANGRRRLKRYIETAAQGEPPIEDEYFYDGDKLLEDKGRPRQNDASGQALDEYLWLDGRPVAFLRSFLNADFTRSPDTSTQCARDGEDAAACGVYFIVTDYLKKPVLVLNAKRQVAGSADYEPFGHVNRVTVVSDSASLPAPRAKRVLAYIQQPVTPRTAVDIRARFALVDAPSGWGVGAYFSDIWGNRLGSGDAVTGVPHQGKKESAWTAMPSNGMVHLRYTGPDALGSGAAAPYAGLVLEEYEYRRYEAGAQPMWTPLRFPGQYHDAETDLFENWNRYYDPSIGRYLGPEPMYNNPGWVLDQARKGHSAPVYAYALNNPVGFTDPDGNNAFAVCLVAPQVCISAAVVLEAAVATAWTAIAAAAVSPRAAGKYMDDGPASTRRYDPKAAIEARNAALEARAKEADRPSTLEPGPHAGEGVEARGPERDFTQEERDAVNAEGADKGCHTCGTKDPGTKSGNFIPDHQPPSATVEPGTPQRLYPHCLECSRTQGGEVDAELNRK
ncbi:MULTISPECIES: RHS repeat-associated core domain-containing protein [Myxococcaceae]|uniref:RHS repeat-associated core domain-containing protein n=1 Tax=Myxococcaceae TaxID=31 RepID=UPI00188E2F29|nr:MULTISPECIES: RHS repeat-associated core domain-containing protein [Myxococcaceae]MBF5044513.1 RHS repeat-associated core domain-containing protein [Simulacricoccus sp. 17bor-14]